MDKSTSRNKLLLQLAQKGGNDATMMLFDMVIELQDKFDEFANTAPQLESTDSKAEKIAIKLATKLANIEKGESGETPTDDQLIALITPLIPPVTDGHTPTSEELLALIRPLIPEVEDGDTPTDEHLLELIKPLIPQVAVPTANDVANVLEKDLPSLGASIRDGLELLQGDDRLDKSAIKGLDEVLKEVVGTRTGSFSGGGSSGGTSGGRSVKSYDLTPMLDGVTKTFALPTFWRIISVQSSSFPNAFRENVDWTSDGSAMTLTFTSEIVAGTTLAAGQTITVVFSEP